ncbi:MAG TPA: efflux transporter outer membrane subunit [Desulfomonilia bacterium]|nr:efflux transporter outer membrane subunit [Desulfomonilia bacterium]
MKKASIFLITIALAGCAIGPDYQRPAQEMPMSWRFEEQTAAKDAANMAWWEQFNDPVLKELIQIALQENKDVKIAAARVEQFMGLYGTTRSALFPQVGAGGVASRQQISEVTKPSPLQGSGVDPAFSTYDAFLSAGWEIDLWGKLRRADEAARANLLGSEEARRAVVLTLVTSVASSYVILRDLDRQFEIAKQTAMTREDSYKLFKLRFEGGVVSELELTQVKSQYEEALASIPYYEKLIAQQENALSVLLGRNPGPIPRGKPIDDLVQLSVPAGLPSDLLANRPDLRQAEEDLIAANANIGVAKALYFPSISLTGALGSASSDLSDLFTGPAGTWSYGANIAAPIFTAGGIAGQVKAAEAVQQQTLLRYQQAIQNAFREVEDALVDQKRSREQLEAQNNQVATLRQYAHIARLRFDEGYTSYLEVLDAERSLFNAQLSYAQTQGTISLSLVNVYKAFGGGWIVEADRLTVPAAEAPANGAKEEQP